MTVLVIAGEISGDLYAARLVTALKKRRPETPIASIGGPQLKAVSDVFIYETVYEHGVNLASEWFGFSRKRHLRQVLSDAHVTHGITQVVIVDFQHFNQVIADFFSALSIPVDTFITPNFWMWKDRKCALAICQYSRHIFTIFKPEYEFYKSLSSHVYFFGHPMADVIEPVKARSFSPVTSPHIVLLPGSRPQEFRLYFKAMLASCVLLQKKYPSLTITVCVSSDYYMPIISSYLEQYPALPIHCDFLESSSVIQSGDLVLCASGSATLEAVLLRRPLIVLAALPPVTYFIVKYILRLKLDYISLPNVLSGTELVPEFVQSAIKPTDIVSSAEQLLLDPAAAVSGYNVLQDSLRVDPPISSCIADVIFSS